MKIVFRTDASIDISTGHVMRCLTLAELLHKHGHDCHFICKAHEGHLGDLIIKRGFKLHLLTKPFTQKNIAAGELQLTHAEWLGGSWQQDAKETQILLDHLKPSWLVVDHYALDARWERQAAKKVNNILVIDDLADRNHECSLLLDQNLGRKPSDYYGLVPQNCKRLIGPGYALLRPEFAQLRKRSIARRNRPVLRRIMVSLGGVDKTNGTALALEALTKASLPPDTHLDIIMGTTAPHLHAIQQQAVQSPYKTTVSIDVTDMAERMCLADMAIGAAGSSSWERCCLGLPSILLVIADNQQKIASALEKKGAASIVSGNNLELSLQAGISELTNSENQLKKMTTNATSICDGKGVTRVINAMNEVFL